MMRQRAAASEEEGSGKKAATVSKKACVCGWDECRELSKQYAQHCDMRRGHTSLPRKQIKYSVEKNNFVRQRWLFYLGLSEESELVQSTRDLRISKCHFHLRDFRDGKLERWKQGRQTIVDADVLSLADDHKETLAVPGVSRTEMREELARIRTGRYIVNAAPPSEGSEAELKSKLLRALADSDDLKSSFQRLEASRDDSLAAGRRIGATLRREVEIRDRKVFALEKKVVDLQNRLTALNAQYKDKLRREAEAKDRIIARLRSRLEEHVGRKRKHHQLQQSPPKRLRADSTLAGADLVTSLLHPPRLNNHGADASEPNSPPFGGL